MRSVAGFDDVTGAVLDKTRNPSPKPCGHDRRERANRALAVIWASASWITERAVDVSTRAPSKTVPLPRTAEPSTRNSPADLTNPIEGDAAETTSSEPATIRDKRCFNILGASYLNSRLECIMRWSGEERIIFAEYLCKTWLDRHINGAIN